ncbi:MAG TPA: pitrilysin family protein, partial [Candidatus Omnitrophota bacterium]|nr:pitrilysin family protein [Candidatus Omnitrophota bacterium]
MSVSRLTRWGAASAFALSLVTLPAAAQVFNPTTYTLGNGMQVVVVENHRAPIATHMVWYRVGAADEPAGKSGIAHLLEHLMFKGTPEIPPGQFSKIVARNGGRDNAFTSSDYTAYFQNIAIDRLELVMKMEADRMRNLTLDDQNVVTERAVVLEERSSRTDNDPSALLMERVEATLYLNHPYRRPVIGWGSELAGLTRADAEAFYRTWYAPNNAILVVAGDVKPDEVKALAEKYYGPLKPENTPDRQKLRAEEPPQVAARRVVLEDARVQQPSWSRQYVAPSYTHGRKELAYPLQVLSEILGGGATSRMYKSLVVEQGVAAGASAWYDPSALDSSTFGLGATPRPGVPMDKLEAALNAEIAKVAQGITAEEVERAKARLKANVAYARDSLHTAARVLGEALTTGQSVADVEAWPERIAAVTPEQVNEAARAVLDERASVTGVL